MPWALRDGTFWRWDGGDDILVTNRASFLRLNGPSASAFERILGIPASQGRRPTSSRDISELLAVLKNAQIVERVESVHDPHVHFLGHVASVKLQE